VFDHVTIRAAQREASERFYELVLSPLGVARTSSDETYAEWDDFSLAQASAERPVTRRLHIGFSAPSRAHVDEFWRVGREAGFRDDGAPGPRPQYGSDYYGGFLLDPDANSAEAVHHGSLRTDGTVDHVWIRVSDVAAAKRFYEIAGRYGGFGLSTDTPERAQFKGPSGSFSVVAGEELTENVHMAFGAGDEATVRDFHKAMVAAGYRDNGSPGERAAYHAGYYGAFVLDPDGNNIEVVHHHREPPA
jgi:catechol 2,3-dioxygenase-like lactoylglutathione lyase family enzyme